MSKRKSNDILENDNKKNKKDENIIITHDVKEKKKDTGMIINTIDDLIYLIKSKKIKIGKSIDYLKLSSIIPPLQQLKELIGMDNIKKEILGQISYFILGFQDKNEDLLHIVIDGPPGVGKTTLGRIIGEIYANLEIIQAPLPIKQLGLRSNIPKGQKKVEKKFIFRDVKRSDLVAEYLGQTAPKTQAVINSALGGVLFIDEAYSLGSSDRIDSFSKECIDTLNVNLTEKKNQFLCIIAGYKEALENNFFAHNEGLARRFPFRYSIEKYTSNQLADIYVKMMTKNTDWIIDIKKEDLIKIFKDNHNLFPNSAGDIETLVFATKIEHAKRVVSLDLSHRKIIKLLDIENSITYIRKIKGTAIKDDTSHLMMYL